MTKKITYTNESLGDIEVIADFLPSPADLAFREEGVKVTLALSKNSVDFFKLEAAKHQTQYQRMIQRVLDSYVEAHATRPVTGAQSGRPQSGRLNNLLSVRMQRRASLSKFFSQSPSNLFSGVLIGISRITHAKGHA